MAAYKPEDKPLFFVENNQLPCIHHVFEQLATKTPNNVAVVFKEKSLSYKELNEAANKLAAYLIINLQVKPGDFVGIMLDRSEYMMIGILAILKAGGAFVPIDPDGNPERTSFIIADAGVKVILCDGHTVGADAGANAGLIDITDFSYYTGDGGNVSGNVTSDDLAYVIYTSGSTGAPKGALVRHNSLMNFISVFIGQFKITEADVFLQSSVFFFDASIMELFVPLASGASVAFLEPAMHKYPEKVIRAIEENKITMLFFTPAFLQLLLDYMVAVGYDAGRLKTLKRIIVGGEVLSVKLANMFNKILFSKAGVGLTNIYGPTEATVWVTTWDCESQEELHLVPIGKPIPNAEVYILDKQLNVLEAGEAGELVIAGIPVGKGYLNRPELDAEKFVENPFISGAKMYRTGDKARYQADGNIEFLGRMDNQVKLNGLRIELGEIESAILKFGPVKECAVLMKEVGGTNELVAYITLTDELFDETTVIDELVAVLNLHLPKYMVPGFYLKLKKFLITGNGKIDRKNLPLPTSRYYKTQQPYAAPVNETEKKLVSMFESNLSIDKIGVNEPIFNFGIKSLTVTKILIEIRTRLKSKISISQFFQLQTIRDIAAFIENPDGENSNPFTLIRPGEGSALFLLPGALGTPTSFSAFVDHYPANIPIYSILFQADMASSVIKSFNLFETLYDYAAYLLPHIKKISPYGPYNFAGYSFGGSLAFEIAAQLQLLGDKIGLLAVVGAEPPRLEKNNLKWEPGIFIKRELSVVTKLNRNLRVEYYKNRLPYVLKKLLIKYLPFNGRGKFEQEIDLNFSEFQNGEDLFHLIKFEKLIYAGSPSLFNGDMVLVSEHMKTSVSNRNEMDYYVNSILPKLWKQKVTGDVRYHILNCSHLELISEPYLKQIASIIKSYFDADVKKNHDNKLNPVVA